MGFWKITPKLLYQAQQKLRVYGTLKALSISERIAMSYYNYLGRATQEECDKFINEAARKRIKRIRNRSPSPIISEWNSERIPSPYSFDDPMGAPTIDEDAERFRCRSRTPVPDNDSNKYIYTSNWDPNPTEVEANNNNTTTSTQFGYGVTLHSSPIQNRFEMGALENIGNSCYMNAVLYVLRFTPTFQYNLHHFLFNVLLLLDEIDENCEVSSNNCVKCKATVAMKSNKNLWPNDIPSDERNIGIIKQLHKVFVKLTNIESKRSGSALRTNDLQGAVFQVNRTFEPFRQQDSHEFLMFVLNCLRDLSDTFSKIVEDHPESFERFVNEIETMIIYN